MEGHAPKYGSYKTANRRLLSWQREGVWERILRELLNRGYKAGKILLENACVDSTTLEAKKGEEIGLDGARRKKGTKVLAMADERGVPLSLSFLPANRHDSKGFFSVVEGIGLRGRRGRPRKRPLALHADSAFDSKEIREWLRRKGIKTNIAVNLRRGRRRGLSLAVRGLRRMRGVVERFFSWLKCGFRRLSVRWERGVEAFKGLVYFACFLIAWRVLR